eukprot:scaffold77298_cov63-Phaeocystis_antarctica.AAC.6
MLRQVRESLQVGRVVEATGLNGRRQLEPVARLVARDDAAQPVGECEQRVAAAHRPDAWDLRPSPSGQRWSSCCVRKEPSQRRSSGCARQEVACEATSRHSASEFERSPPAESRWYQAGAHRVS